MTIGQAYKSMWCNYFDFNDCATPSEYWWDELTNKLIKIGLFLLALLFSPIRWIFYIYAIAMLIPGISVFIRRMNDSGTPLAVSIVYIVLRELLFWWPMFIMLGSSLIQDVFMPANKLKEAESLELMAVSTKMDAIGKWIFIALILYAILRICGLIALCQASKKDDA